MVAVGSIAIIAVIKIWHLLEISIRCFSWEEQPNGHVQNTKWLLHMAEATLGLGSQADQSPVLATLSRESGTEA